MNVRPYVSEIDGVRGFLSLVVLLAHLNPLNPAWILWAHASMDAFFCISGFVITRILLSHLGRPGFYRSYLARRALRIWPMYYVGLLFAATVFFLLGVKDPRTGSEIAWTPHWYEVVLPFVFLQNTEGYFSANSFAYLPLFNHSWSVAIEEQYYFLWPLLLPVFFGGRSLTFRVMLLALALSLSFAFRVSGWSALLLLSRLDGFIFGGCLAYWEVRRHYFAANAFRWLWVIPVAFVTPQVMSAYGLAEVALSPLIRKIVFDQTFWFALLTCALLGFCIFANPAESRRNLLVRLLNLPVLRHLGVISYSTYILHVPIVFSIVPYLTEQFGLPAWSRYPLGIFGSVGLAHLTYKAIEWPMLRLKDRYEYSGKMGGVARPVV